MTINFQEAYNIVSVIGFGICMYKIHKLEILIELMKTNQILSAMASFAITKTLKDKGIIDENELSIEVKKEEK
jgi:hypothetical protein